MQAESLPDGSLCQVMSGGGVNCSVTLSRIDRRRRSLERPPPEFLGTELLPKPFMAGQQYHQNRGAVSRRLAAPIAVAGENADTPFIDYRHYRRCAKLPRSA